MKTLALQPTYRMLFAKYQALTAREKVIIIVAAIVAVFILLYQVYEPIRRIFTQQKEQLSTLDASMKTVAPGIERYVKLRARRDAIEEEYKEVEFKEGALSHLENLVRNKAGISSGFTIKDNPPKEFGGNYEQTLFNIKFTTTNLETLVAFLSELTNGAKPLVVSKIDIQRSKFADRLEVDVDASSIRRLK
ncbi:MAG: type II secretion system protein M [Deltaproteobacteria bacterium]|nr:type II secretion system protein M [Deltaproteobacteria bacterium]